jgi:hypothetical protein
MRIPPSFIFVLGVVLDVVRSSYVVRSSRAANTSAARRGDARTIARTTGRRPALRLYTPLTEGFSEALSLRL